MRKGTIEFCSDKKFEVRVLPCQINYNGNVDSSSYIPDNSIGSLYGRKVCGQSLKVPEGFSGFVGSEAPMIQAKGSFSDLTYWNWDTPASDTDQIPQILSHLALMKKIAEA